MARRSRISWGKRSPAGISYPADGTGGPFGAVAVVSGHTGTQADVAWYGPTLASSGFVVLTIDTNATTDLATDRADQLLAALELPDDVEPGRGRGGRDAAAVMGWSMEAVARSKPGPGRLR